ncbi:TonB-dependent receptor [candidate division KSB1 bacterium]|nr:TonB-dependent receptor [candidate division KSB1 bacterium]
MHRQYIAALWIWLLAFGVKWAGADELVLQGMVRDINTHHEIPYVNIFLIDTKIGTTSDFAGRFELKIPKSQSGMKLIFQHIAYNRRIIAADSLKKFTYIDLQPRVIPLQTLIVEAAGEPVTIKKDLPQPITLMEAKDFEVRGFTDAGDFLRSEHSIQVTEDLSGKKTVAMRGGNADEVTVLYNGVKMNSALDNVFDLSLIDLEDVERLELIKGSNTTLYGSGALGGIINIVPSVQQDYHVRFQQRIGSYRSGNWGLSFYQPIQRLHTTYSYKRGMYRRSYTDATNADEFLENQASHHTANLVYDFTPNPNVSEKNSLGAMYIRSKLNYLNPEDDETLDNLNQITALRYQGNIGFLRHLSLSTAYHQLLEDHAVSTDTLYPANKFYRHLVDDLYSVNFEKALNWRASEFLLGYQYENARLHYQNKWAQTELNDVHLKRNLHGFTAITKLHAPSGADYMPYLDFDLSLRHDRVQDQKDTEASVLDPRSVFESTTYSWNETTVKFSSDFKGHREDVAFNFYFNVGKNIKFPSLFQQISQPFYSNQILAQPNLNPEKNNSTEFGVEVTRSIRNRPEIYGWQINLNYFRNYYQNKFRTFYVPGMPVTYYDNVRNASINGLEGQTNVFMFQKKLTFELGFAYYSISEKTAFPFKYDLKYTADIKLDHLGYAFQFHFFYEGQQLGWVRQSFNQFVDITLPQRSDIDLHLSKAFRISRFKIITNASVRNLLNHRQELVGLALEDRRFYLTFGIQY